MGPEELGSVYESLLELVPQITEGGRAFSFASGAETKGHARKTTGSYYTPDSLVQVLLDSALEPVVERTINEHPNDAVEALLSLSVVDPACGSGHFLLAATRRLAAHVARLQADGTPSAAEYRHALRQVVGRCIYGVDLNAMAVELCKVSLWMEAVEPGLPLTFLDSHIWHGNALLGTTPNLMDKGVPDDAWKPIEGDDKKVASAIKKRNKDSTQGQRGLDTLWSKPKVDEAAELRQAIAGLESAPDIDAAALAAKESRWQELLDSKVYQHQKLVADAWCAAFVWPKQPGPLAEAAPTNELWRQIRDGQGHPPELTVKTVNELAEQYTFFHWHLAFPQVFARGGFDVVLGNPPWDSLRFSEEEFFANRVPEIAAAPTAAKRKKLIKTLAQNDSRLLQQFLLERRKVEGDNIFVRTSSRYPYCGLGRVNLFALFAETMAAVMGHHGRVGAIVPSGIVTDDSTKAFFSMLMTSGSLVSLFDFENREGLFEGVHRNYKFSLLTAERPGSLGRCARFVFYAGNVSEIGLDEKVVLLSNDDIKVLNPLSKTSPTFRTSRDSRITLGVHRRFPILAQSDWNMRLRRLINQSDDSGHFVAPDEPQSLPLYEGKYFHLYDHRWTTCQDTNDRAVTDAEKDDPNFCITPRYRFPEKLVRERFAHLWGRPWVLAWRDITNATNERTLIASLLPSLAVPNTAKVFLPPEDHLPLVPALQANLSSVALDFIARQKIGWTHMATFTVEQLPVIGPHVYGAICPWNLAARTADWVIERSLELAYTGWDLKSFAEDMKVAEPPFRWDPERRFLLRAELDAAFFHLYGIERDDVDYIMETFPIVRKNDEKAHGEYRTKRVILEIYDAMAEAVRTGKPYQTRLDPSPADPRVAHPPREGGQLISLPVRPATRRRPAVAAVLPDLAAVGSNAWTRPHTLERGEIQVAILAVLKAYGAPMDRRAARLAALLCLEPHLLISLIDEAGKTHWIRVVGGDAGKAASASIVATAQEWGAALTGLRGRGRLIEDLQKNTWEVGADAIDTSGWPDGRASFVVNVLRRLQESAQVDTIVLRLPTNVQQWLSNAA